MVFQNHALLPHLTVFENLAFGLMLRRLPKEEINRRVRAAADMLTLAPLLERKPPALSGGECQRVALGRAMVRQPKVFLFDEPLSNLDAPIAPAIARRNRRPPPPRRGGDDFGHARSGRGHGAGGPGRGHEGRRVATDGRADGAVPTSCESIRGRFMGSPPMNFFQGTLARENGSVVFQGGQENKLTVAVEGGRAAAFQAASASLSRWDCGRSTIGEAGGGPVAAVGRAGGGGGRGEFCLLFEPRLLVCDESALAPRRQKRRQPGVALRYDPGAFF